MNQQKLIQRLAELSGMVNTILIVAEDSTIDVLAGHLSDCLDGLIEKLQSEEKLESSSRFQALHSCNHQWKQIAPDEYMCTKCGERGD